MLQHPQVFRYFYFISYIATAMRFSPSCRRCKTTMTHGLSVREARPA